MADYEAQIVVIAGGPSGLAAAVQAAEDGADVILIEKNAAIGGAAALISRSIKKSELLAYEDLGTEAIYRFTVEDFPAIVVIDSYGKSVLVTG